MGIAFVISKTIEGQTRKLERWEGYFWSFPLNFLHRREISSNRKAFRVPRSKWSINAVSPIGWAFEESWGKILSGAVTHPELIIYLRNVLSQ